MLSFDCPHCGRHFEVGEEFAGRKVRCKACQDVFTVPGGEWEGGEAPLAPDAGGPLSAPSTMPPPAYSAPPQRPMPIPPQYGGYAPSPSAYGYPPPKPAAVTFYLVYLILMIIMCLMLIGMGALILSLPASQFQGQDPAEVTVIGTVYLVTGIVMLVPFAIGLFINKGKAAWIYGIVMIAIGLTSCLCWPIAIPLLVFWLQDPTRQYYYSQSVQRM